MVPCPSLSQKSSLCARTVQEEATEEADRISSHGTERKEGVTKSHRSRDLTEKKHCLDPRSYKQTQAEQQTIIKVFWATRER